MNSRTAYHSKSFTRQRGLATVEFAISTAVILLVALATAEIGRIYYSYNTLTKAVRSGSRYLSTEAMNPASVVDLSHTKKIRTRNLVVHGNPGGNGESLLEGLTLNDIKISQHNPSETISHYIKVSADFYYQPMLGVVSGFRFGENLDFGFTMYAASTMRVLK